MPGRFNHRCGQPFGRGEHHCPGIGRPGYFALPIGPPRPDIDDLATVDINRQCPTPELAAGVQPSKGTDDSGETGVAGTLHAEG